MSDNEINNAPIGPPISQTLINMDGPIGPSGNNGNYTLIESLTESFTVPTVVQSVAFHQTSMPCVMPGTPVVGNTLIAFVFGNIPAVSGSGDAGWDTLLLGSDTSISSSVVQDIDNMGIFAKTVISGDTATLTPVAEGNSSDGNVNVTIFELLGPISSNLVCGMSAYKGNISLAIEVEPTSAIVGSMFNNTITNTLSVPEVPASDEEKSFIPLITSGAIPIYPRNPWQVNVDNAYGILPYYQDYVSNSNTSAIIDATMLYPYVVDVAMWVNAQEVINVGPTGPTGPLVDETLGSVVQSAAFTQTFMPCVMPNVPTIGNTLVALVYGQQELQANTGDAGWSALSLGSQTDPSDLINSKCGIFIKTVESGDTKNLNPVDPGEGFGCMIYEILGPVQSNVHSGFNHVTMQATPSTSQTIHTTISNALFLCAFINADDVPFEESPVIEVSSPVGETAAFNITGEDINGIIRGTTGFMSVINKGSPSNTALISFTRGGPYAATWEIATLWVTLQTVNQGPQPTYPITGPSTPTGPTTPTGPVRRLLVLWNPEDYGK